MRFAQDQLVRMGTAVLAETADACLHGRPHRGPGLRLALALLYGLSDGPREPYVIFWKICGIADGQGKHAADVARGRYQRAWAAYRAILAGLGDDWPGGGAETVDTRHRRRFADRGPPKPQRSGNDTRMIAPQGKSCG